jgi:apolipoprotein D and lipocalin family protein
MRLSALSLMLVMACAAYAASELTVVPSVDLKRYAGTWYEIARFPTWFQKDCTSDVSATYALKDNGNIEVLNACKEANGKTKQARGTAKLADKKGPNSKLKVTFFWPFYGDYWIINLDPDYKWAVVGAPGRNYLWILSRTPQISDDLHQRLVEDAKQKGFDTSRLVRTKQTTR